VARANVIVPFRFQENRLECSYRLSACSGHSASKRMNVSVSNVQHTLFCCDSVAPVIFVLS